MKKEFLFFHPNLKSKSVANKMIWEECKEKGYDPVDVYELYGDFKIDPKREQKRLESADHIYFVFPLYWYNSPSLLKEYIDIVWEMGWCWGYTGVNDALKGKPFSFIVTAGSTEQNYTREGGSKRTLPEFLSWLYETIENFTQARVDETIGIFQAQNVTKEIIKNKLKNI